MIKRKSRQIRRLSTEQIGRKGHRIYTKLGSKLAGEKKGRVVAVDIRSGDFAVADNSLAAADELRARHPDADIWLERIGAPTLRRFGTWREN
ncbi:MAG TPA: hypothetical protein VGN88_06705 [Phycisphaerae bacterium]|jgi:hypothetical protein